MNTSAPGPNPWKASIEELDVMALICLLFPDSGLLGCLRA